MPYTLSAPAEYREEIKKSRFITHAAPIGSVEEAQAFLARMSDPAATHNCWAWKLGNQYRFNDDGEPGGTAGRPILAAIEGQECDQVAVLVIRYYGGIQLGTGGLARAYGGGAAKCLQGAERVELVARSRVRCHPAFAELALVKARLAEFEALVESEAFDTDGAELVLALPEARIDALAQVLRDISRGRMTLKRL
ncbi:IMPACT family protein [Pseudomonas sp. A46]|nr:YigZ family protein [Pseudomonas sp. A46]OWJ96944.1 thymidylate synthase [Pseudomonas sp. A46]